MKTVEEQGARANTVPVSYRAAIQRINRALAKDGRQLKASRGARATLDMGDFYIVDAGMNFVLEKDVDVEILARSLGVIKPYERVDD